MTNAHYIIFHPDDQRQSVEVSALALDRGKTIKNWRGKVWVDQLDCGNEDPFIFNNPWIYSYCHASQLRRSAQNESYVTRGSWLIFASGDLAEADGLSIDTVFYIGNSQKWDAAEKPIIPDAYRYLLREKSNLLYSRHFFAPLECTHSDGRAVHGTVSYTYEAELWENGKEKFSFLPLDQVKEKVAMPLSVFGKLGQKIRNNVPGKRPVDLSSIEMELVLQQIESRTRIKVVRDINLLQKRSKPSGCGPCNQHGGQHHGHHGHYGHHGRHHDC
jgi:hypothetical protein